MSDDLADLKTLSAEHEARAATAVNDITAEGSHDDAMAHIIAKAQIIGWGDAITPNLLLLGHRDIADQLTMTPEDESDLAAAIQRRHDLIASL